MEFINWELQVFFFMKIVLSSQHTINEIDHGEETIYFRHSEYFTFVLITKGRSQEFLERLIAFTQKFNKEFSQKMEQWKGNAEIFDTSSNFIHSTFIK